ELMKVRGSQVTPAELEDHLMAHPYVADACVVSILDEYSGEISLALLVPSAAAKSSMEAGTDESAVCLPALRVPCLLFISIIRGQHCGHVSDHKVKEKWLTGGVRFIDVVPKSPSGKLLCRILRDKLRAEGSDVVG
ncbi:hypothetical protein DFH09DRAFT_961487, partial [Mycena vulgaris]